MSVTDSKLFFHGVWRMDIGFGNPNKTATLFAMLMVAAWAFLNIRRWGYWGALGLFTFFGFCLVHTFSRGGMCAAFVGVGVMLFTYPKRWYRFQLIGVGVALTIIAAASLQLGATRRYAQGLLQEDLSITHRLAIWKEVPRMMVDAPEGWGGGESGRAYMEWYQPLSRFEEYRTLVSSHLTWLVELGWPFRLGYVFAWLLILRLCWPSPATPVRSIGLGIWTAFGISGLFSSVAESRLLWILPGMSLFAILLERIAKGCWPQPKFYAKGLYWAAAIAFAFFVAVYNIVGRASESTCASDHLDFEKSDGVNYSCGQWNNRRQRHPSAELISPSRRNFAPW
jgi:hypothetical protein